MSTSSGSGEFTAFTIAQDDFFAPYSPNFAESEENQTLSHVSQDSFNSSSKDLEYYFFYKTEQLTFLWVIFVMIIFGNFSVLGALMFSSRKSRMNFFIKHLAIADLLVGLLNVFTDIVWKMTVGFYAGNIACKMVKYGQVCVTYGSTFVLVSMSIDRYDAITHPLNFTSRARRAKFLIAIAWALSALFALPTVFLNEERTIKGFPQCWMDLEQEQWQIYMTLVATTVFFVPAVIISACYFIIVKTIWREGRLMSGSKKRLKQLNGTVSNSRNGNSLQKFAGFESTDIDFKRMSSRGVIPKAKIKTIKMTLVIVLVFILCWSPYMVWDLLQVYGYIPETKTTVAVSTFIQSLAPLNSAANPLIYCLFSAHCRNIRKHRIYTWFAEKICFCLPRRQVFRNGTCKSDITSTLTSTFTRSPGQTSITMQTRQPPTNSRGSPTLNHNGDKYEIFNVDKTPLSEKSKSLCLTYANSKL